MFLHGPMFLLHPLFSTIRACHGTEFFCSIWRTLCCVSMVFFLNVRINHRGDLPVHVYTHQVRDFCLHEAAWPFCSLVHGTCRLTLSPTSYSGSARSSIAKKSLLPLHWRSAGPVTGCVVRRVPWHLGLSRCAFFFSLTSQTSPRWPRASTVPLYSAPLLLALTEALLLLECIQHEGVCAFFRRIESDPTPRLHQISHAPAWWRSASGGAASFVCSVMSSHQVFCMFFCRHWLVRWPLSDVVSDTRSMDVGSGIVEVVSGRKVVVSPLSNSRGDERALDLSQGGDRTCQDGGICTCAHGTRIRDVMFQRRWSFAVPVCVEEEDIDVVPECNTRMSFYAVRDACCGLEYDANRPETCTF